MTTMQVIHRQDEEIVQEVRKNQNGKVLKMIQEDQKIDVMIEGKILLNLNFPSNVYKSFNFPVEIAGKQVQNIIEMMTEIHVVMIIAKMIEIVRETVQMTKDVVTVQMIDVIEEMIDVEMIKIMIEEVDEISEIDVIMKKIQILNGEKMK
jgi:hypothetical protein